MRALFGVNSPGLEARNKTINVEANLLAERIAEREKVLIAVRRKFLWLVCVLLSGLLFVPPMLAFSAAESRRTERLAKQQQILAAQLASLQAEQRSAEPKLLQQRMMEDVRGNAQRFLGQLLLVLNAAPPQMAFASVKADMNSGEMRIVSRADAESYTAARQFVDGAKGGPGVVDTITSSTRRSDTLGPSGVTFEFVKRVRMDP